MTEQLTLDGQPAVKAHNLSVYLVGDHDYYAANSAAEAEQLHAEYNNDDDHGDTAQLVTGALLDTPWQDEDNPGVSTGTLRQWLAEATEPAWLCGTE